MEKSPTQLPLKFKDLTKSWYICKDITPRKNNQNLLSNCFKIQPQIKRDKSMSDVQTNRTNSLTNVTNQEKQFKNKKLNKFINKQELKIQKGNQQIRPSFNDEFLRELSQNNQIVQWVQDLVHEHKIITEQKQIFDILLNCIYKVLFNLDTWQNDFKQNLNNLEETLLKCKFIKKEKQEQCKQQLEQLYILENPHLILNQFKQMIKILNLDQRGYNQEFTLLNSFEIMNNNITMSEIKEQITPQKDHSKQLEKSTSLSSFKSKTHINEPKMMEAKLHQHSLRKSYNQDRYQTNFDEIEQKIESLDNSITQVDFFQNFSQTQSIKDVSQSKQLDVNYNLQEDNISLQKQLKELRKDIRELKTQLDEAIKINSKLLDKVKSLQDNLRKYSVNY